MKKHGRFVCFAILILTSKIIFADIDPQIVKMNLQIKSKKENHNSELAMPYYQKAELENKDYVIELNPRKGKNKDEILLGYKLIKTKSGKSVKSGEVVLTSNKPLNVQAKGLSFKVAPVL